MAKADRVLSTLPLNTPIPDTYRTPLSSYLFEAAAIVIILVASGIAGCVIARQLNGPIAAHCTVDLQQALR